MFSVIRFAVLFILSLCTHLYHLQQLYCSDNMSTDPINYDQIRERIRFMMEKLNINANTFAENAGVTPSVLSNFMNQRNNISIDTLNKIIVTYPEWSANWLLFGQEPEKRSYTNELFPIDEVETNAPYPNTRNYQNQLVNNANTAQIQINVPKERTIEEIRVFFSDGSFEVFKKA